MLDSVGYLRGTYEERIRYCACSLTTQKIIISMSFNFLMAYRFFHFFYNDFIKKFMNCLFKFSCVMRVCTDSYRFRICEKGALHIHRCHHWGNQSTCEDLHIVRYTRWDEMGTGNRKRERWNIEIVRERWGEESEGCGGEDWGAILR